MAVVLMKHREFGDQTPPAAAEEGFESARWGVRVLHTTAWAAEQKELALVLLGETDQTVRRADETSHRPAGQPTLMGRCAAQTDR